MANPQSRQAGSPWPLTPTDTQRYREIFALQRKGHWRAADNVVETLENDLLLGHVLAQRYLHPTQYRSRYHELATWLSSYGDHPDAARIYKLALKRRPTQRDTPPRPAPKPARLQAPQLTPVAHQPTKKLTKSERRQASRYKKRIKRNLRRTQLTKTERLLRRPEVKRLLDKVEIDGAYSEIAAGWLYHGDTDRAFELASEVTRRSGTQLPISHWTAGLAAWRLNRLGIAARHFEAVALSDKASGWNRSAGAYWAARAYLRSLNIAMMQRWLSVAANYPLTFYGMLARSRLELTENLNFEVHRLHDRHLGELLATSGGTRALALVQSGQPGRAEQEMMRLGDWDRPGLIEAALALAAHAELPRLSLRLAGHALSDERAGRSEESLVGALYPIPPWQPEESFLLDRALIYAFMRQESSFDPLAKSPDGARGLMQLMPRTAAALDPKRKFTGGQRKLLYDPGLNIELGQRYLKKLLSSQRVRANLFRLAVAYNAGPGNLAVWERRMNYNDDPLLFLESLPTLETRLFVERVLTNLWIYRQRLGQATPSLQALTSNAWPRYRALDPQTAEMTPDNGFYN